MRSTPLLKQRMPLPISMKNSIPPWKTANTAAMRKAFQRCGNLRERSCRHRGKNSASRWAPCPKPSASSAMSTRGVLDYKARQRSLQTPACPEPTTLRPGIPHARTRPCKVWPCSPSCRRISTTAETDFSRAFELNIKPTARTATRRPLRSAASPAFTSRKKDFAKTEAVLTSFAENLRNHVRRNRYRLAHLPVAGLCQAYDASGKPKKQRPATPASSPSSKNNSAPKPLSRPRPHRRGPSPPQTRPQRRSRQTRAAHPVPPIRPANPN